MNRRTKIKEVGSAWAVRRRQGYGGTKRPILPFVTPGLPVRRSIPQVDEGGTRNPFCFFEEFGDPFFEVKWVCVEVKGFAGEAIATLF